MIRVAIIDYGAGNIFSIQQALKRLGVVSVVTQDIAEIQSATHVVFPGVGHAKSAMEQLKNSGLDQLIPKLTQPTLGICLGMQLMCAFSEEGMVEGLGIFPVAVQHLNQLASFAQLSSRNSADFPIPHIGWNDAVMDGKSEAYYFVHSYFVPVCSFTWAISEYPASFSSALRKDNFFGVQFHPEKSGTVGDALFIQFLKQ